MNIADRRPMPLLDHFSWIAPYYDRVFRLTDVEPLMTRVAPESHQRLLDVGGGTGRVAERFVGSVSQVYILDPSPAMLRQGRRKGLRITQGESERLPFRTGAFDRIIVVDAFHHLRDQRVAVQELMRVLAPGGRLVIEEPDIGHWGVKLIALGEKAALMRSQFQAPEAVQAMFEKVGGLTRVERWGYTGWVIVEKG